jgi:hypothetical protein
MFGNPSPPAPLPQGARGEGQIIRDPYSVLKRSY